MANNLPYLRLTCFIQNYAWGKLGSSSEVARLASSEHPQFLVNVNTPYAELWIGTHPSGPCTIFSPLPQLSGQLLSNWIASNLWALGDKTSTDGGQLPFLLKVLSVNKALSIQAHPNKAHAEILHRKWPDRYPDSNHKPELAIALGHFEAFCGFRPYAEIQSFIRSVPELCVAIGVEDAVKGVVQLCEGASEEQKKKALKDVFTALMNAPVDSSRIQLQTLMERIRGNECSGIPDLEKALLLRLCEQYPGDIGCFAVFFLNYLCLQEGQAIFLSSNEPHAYLCGDLVECMACSDNVVRAGLTPKYVDKDTLCQMLTYNMKPAKDNLFPCVVHSEFPHIQIYEPPVNDFGVHRITVPAACGDFTLPILPGPSVMIVISGALDIECCGVVEPLHKGAVIFLPTNRSVQFSNCLEAALIFQAYCH